MQSYSSGERRREHMTIVACEKWGGGPSPLENSDFLTFYKVKLSENASDPPPPPLGDNFCIRAWRVKGMAPQVQNELNVVSQKTNLVGCKLISNIPTLIFRPA